jgi:DNA-binding beta-propeller fold protein YncE
MKTKRTHPNRLPAFPWLAICLMFMLPLSCQVAGQDAIPEIVVSGLRTPSGVAVQPNTGHVFVADSGAQRIVRIVEGKIEPVVVDFPIEKYGKGPSYNIGPLGLLFLDEETLVVGGGGLPDGEDLLRVFKVPSQGNPPIKATEVFGDAKKIAKDGEKPGDGNFYGLAKGSKGIYVTCNGDDLKGWVSLATLSDENRLKKFERTIATREATFVKAPSAITISPQGYITVGQMGEVKDQKDSLLTFYSEAGVTLGAYRTGLYDITGLAYGPKHGRLFATDFHWAAPGKGGLYKLVDIKKDSECEAVLMTALEKPTALAFNNQGDCFVTLAGSAKQDQPPDGKLVIIRALDVDPNK